LRLLKWQRAFRHNTRWRMYCCKAGTKFHNILIFRLFLFIFHSFYSFALLSCQLFLPHISL
jgi:hypothetical protein